MVSVSLLQRLELDSVGVSRTDHTDDSAVLDSILFNLKTILNSRKGCCETRPDFGLSDFNSLSDYRSISNAIAREVERQLKTFEPRLRRVSVQPLVDKSQRMEFVFHVNAELADEHRAVKVSFDSVLGSDGRMRFNN